MKPFGVRLAAGAVTILLGAIMAAQAQKDHQDELQSSWNPLQHVNENNAGDAPAPIGLSQWTDPGDASSADSANAEPSPFADVPGAVKLVQHTESTVADAATTVAGEVSDAVSAALALPSTFAPAAKSDVATPAMTMTFPGDDTDSATPPSTGSPSAGPADPVNLPPTMDAAPQHEDHFAAGGSLQADANGNPSNMLRGGDEFEPADARPANTASAPNQFLGGFAGDQPQQEPATISDGPATQMLRAVAMPDESHNNQYAADDRAAMERQQALAAEEQLRHEMAREREAHEQQAHEHQAREQQAREIDREQQRRADQMLAEEQFNREQLARQQELQAQREGQQRNAAPDMNQFAANDRYPQPMPSRGVSMAGFGGQEQPTAPALPRGQFDNNQYDNARNNGRGAGFRNAGSARRENGMNTDALQVLPAAHKLAAQSGGTFAQPGDRRLEGAQAPSVVIHKRAPSEVKVGKPASFVIQVQNVGSAEALNVRVFDQVPAGMQFKDASPQPQQTGNKNELVWQLGTLAAGEERTVTMELIPVEEGELGSVARVTFEAAASVRTISTRPELKIVQKAPQSVLVGQQLEIEVEVSNPGTGDATGVMLQEDVPDSLEHPRGRELDNLIGTLRPGEVRRQMLRLRAVSPGMIRNTIYLRGDDGLETSHSVDVQIVSPQLQVALVGPGRRFLERQATYSLDIANSGTAPATNVRITAFLDRGFTFVSTGKAGQYDPSRHAVYWQLEDLPVGARGQVPLTLLPVQEGSRSIQLEAKADLGIIAKNEHKVDVESLAELTFSVADSADPIEVGTETVYEIKVANRGSRSDSNVRVQVKLPPGIELIDAEDAETDGRGTIVFRPRAQLAANSELVYRIKARGVRDGRHKIEAIVLSDQSTVPVTKEESTMVYDDRQPAIARGQNRNQSNGQSFRQ